MITQERLKEVLEYSEESGVFVWRISKRGIKVGDVAGHISKKGYIRLSLDGVNYTGHRLAWLYVHGEMPANEIDHVNQAKNDNRIANLRVVTRQQNAKNKGLQRNNTSGQLGVSWNKSRQKWHSQIYISGKSVLLGFFTDLSTAIWAREMAELKHGFHPNHGK